MIREPKKRRIFTEVVNAPFLYQQGGKGEEFRAGLKFAVERVWLELHESGTFRAWSSAPVNGGPRRGARGCRPPLPNELWCADFKCEFKLGNERYCYPLTVTDQASRFLLMCEALESTREDPAVTAFERVFAERGLPLSGFRSRLPQTAKLACRAHLAL